MGHYHLTDFEWSVIQPLLPNKPRGVPRVDDRRVLNGIFWLLRTGALWRDLPERYGPYTTYFNRFNRWRRGLGPAYGRDRHGKNAEETATAIMPIFKRLDPARRRSATFDNDTAFARHGLLRQALELATLFCDAYASWQKGAVENNGRLRRDLPRKIDIDKLSDQEFQDILLMHNLTPRKCLGFNTPAQALLQQLGLDIKISFHRGVALQS